MSGRISLLGALLALQLIIIAAVLLLETDGGGAPEGPFLAFEADAVDELVITSDADASVTLSRGDDGWRLPEGLPADATKVNDLLERLGDLEAPWPVATSGSARARFEVTEDAYQRHLVLRADGETVVDLYLGTSPGYQRVHARRAEADGVFSVALSNFQLPTDSGEWLDKSLLQANGEIVALAWPGHWSLSRGDDGWQLTGAVDSESAGEAGAGTANEAVAAGAEAVDRLVRRFAELRVMGTRQAPAADARPAARFQVTDGDGEYTLTLWRHGDDDPLTIASSRREEHFELASYLADQLMVERDALLPAPAEEDAADSSEEPDSDEGDSDEEDGDEG